MDTRSVLFLLVACGGSKSSPLVPLHDSPSAPSVNLAAEPFQLAAVVHDTDVFAVAPQVTLPSDATLDVGSITSDNRTIGAASLRYSIHTWNIALNDDFERFEKDVAPLFAAAPLPPATALVWSRAETHHAGPIYTSIAIRTPPLLATGDLATANDVAKPLVTFDLASDKSKTDDVHGVDVTLTPEAAARYAEWTATHPGEPVAIVVFGRVAMLTTVRSRDSDTSPLPAAADVTSFAVEFQGVTPSETRAAAAALARAVRGSASSSRARS